MTARIALAVMPSVPLALGAARGLLLSWLLARRLGGQVVLRLEGEADPAQIAAVEADLAWLGLDWDEVSIRAEHPERYAEAARALEEAGRLYPCFETEFELNAKRERRLREGRAAIYDRAMLRLTPEQRASAEAGGKKPHWRFRLSDRPVAWDDLVLGHAEVKLPAMSDPVLVNAEGTSLGVFAAAVDAIAENLTHELREEPLLGTSGIERDVLAALAGRSTRVAFAHPPALSGRGGEKLGRREERLALHVLRADGVLPEVLATVLVGLGRGGRSHVARPAELVENFAIDAQEGAAPRFEMRALLGLNRRRLAAVPFASVADRLPAGATEAFWTAVRGQVDLLSEACGYWEVVAGSIVPPVVEGEEALIEAARACLPEEPWGEDVWQIWTESLAARLQRSAESLEAPLRLALTGEDAEGGGPELAALLPLMGRARAASRLAGAVG